LSGAFFLGRLFEQPLYGLALGVILGGVMQLALQIPYLIRAGFRLKFSFDYRHPGVRSIIKMMGPAFIGIAIYQVNILVGTILASTLPAGSISYIYYSDRINEFVIGIFVISIGNVVLPEMSGLSASNDIEKIGRLFSSSLRGSLFFAIPAAIALMTFGLPIVSVLFMRGEFSLLDVSMTERALFYSSIGIISLSAVRITVPVFFSLKNTGIPAAAALVSFITNICAGYLLMHTELKHAGLTLAVSISATFHMIILLFCVREKIGITHLKAIIMPVIKFFAASLIMACVLLLFKNQVDWLNAGFTYRILYLLAAIIISGVFYILSCFLFKSEEVIYFKNAVIKRIKSGRPAKK
jgi:putative peptidoglycan lipid II flippase